MDEVGMDMEFLEYAEMLPLIYCTWCGKEYSVPDINNAFKLDDISLLWECPLCIRYNCTMDKNIVDELNELGRLIVTGRR